MNECFGISGEKINDGESEGGGTARRCRTLF
jgi:hypothetical protein